MIVPLKEPCPGNRLVMDVFRSALRSSEYDLSDVYCFSSPLFLTSVGFSGLDLKVTV